MDKKDGVDEVSEKIKSFMWYVFAHIPNLTSMKCFCTYRFSASESVRKLLFRVCVCVCVYQR
jgi:hypothetical protein